MCKIIIPIMPFCYPTKDKSVPYSFFFGTLEKMEFSSLDNWLQNFLKRTIQLLN